MHLETGRLRLYPLSLAQLRAARFRLRPVVRAFDADMEALSLIEWWQKRRIFSAKASIIELYPRAWLLSTSWLIVDMSERRLVGDVGFKGPPGAAHSVEIGYSTRKEDRRRGIMTEAVGAMTAFAFAQNDYRVDTVTAYTRHDNRASQRVLEKNGYERTPSSSRYMYWVRRRG